jgi:hypothetical protein
MDEIRDLDNEKTEHINLHDNQKGVHWKELNSEQYKCYTKNLY